MSQIRHDSTGTHKINLSGDGLFPRCYGPTRKTLLDLDGSVNGIVLLNASLRSSVILTRGERHRGGIRIISRLIIVRLEIHMVNTSFRQKRGPGETCFQRGETYRLFPVSSLRLDFNLFKISLCGGLVKKCEVMWNRKGERQMPLSFSRNIHFVRRLLHFIEDFGEAFRNRASVQV